MGMGWWCEDEGMGWLTFVQFGVGVLDDVSGDAGLVGAGGDAVLEFFEEAVHVDVAALAEGDGFLALAGEEAEEGNIILPIHHKHTVSFQSFQTFIQPNTFPSLH